MVPSLQTLGLWAGILASSAIAGPVAIRSPDFALEQRDIQLYQFDLGSSFVNKNLIDQNGIKVDCISCVTSGTALLSTSGVTENSTLLGDIEEILTGHASDIISNAFDLDLRVDFQGLTGSFDLGFAVSTQQTYRYNIYTSITPIGGGVNTNNEHVDVGVVLLIDLVFSLTEEIDLTGGFTFSFPEGFYLIVDPINGHIVESKFTAAHLNSIPIEVVSGSGTFKAALQVRVQAGVTITVDGYGFDFELAAAVDVIEYVADITVGGSDTCEWQFHEKIDVNIGAYASFVDVFDYTSFGFTPSTVTTIFSKDLASYCQTKSSTAVTSTTVPQIAATTTSSDAEVTPTDPGDIFHHHPTPSSSSDTATITGPGDIFHHHPTPSSSVSYSNATITSAPVLTTSTVWGTHVITVISCKSTVLNCPASLTSEVVITSTEILYTTVCPVGEEQPTTLPATFPVATTSPYVFVPTVSLIILSPLPTPIVETFYTPTFSTAGIPVVTGAIIPGSPSNWNNTAVTSTIVPVPTSAPGEITAPPAATATPVEFTGAASRSVQESVFGVLLVFVGFLVL